ncbi:hypothetical protein DYBT9623_01826 [Dyadobacter sp. CECT 9623]|uniref:Uncharacterized protein n=1 Tax=Dyadobacter linearis TaxID=2823330 RepID=A0ABM8UNL0_9BACT|nr:hypothetical protein [Dyadobacter sp. CECT 9623]CAG5069091.1 hypothetical protein DYBT9623_01826 [Dyadobacter sp. CECT 9623]
MQNERLFDKIREASQTNNAGSEDFNPEKIWASVKEKQKPKTVWLWWPYAAASVLLLIVITISVLKPEKQQVLANKSITPAISPKLHADKLQTDNKLVGKINPGFEIVTKPIKNQPDQEDFKPENQISVNENTEVAAPQVADIPTVTQPIESSINIANTVADSVTAKPRAEKVLIADIDLPEENTVQLSALQRIFDQVKKDRKARKMRLQFDRNVGKPTFWSFVQQSFVEYPTVVKPSPPQKNLEMKH